MKTLSCKQARFARDYLFSAGILLVSVVQKPHSASFSGSYATTMAGAGGQKKPRIFGAFQHNQIF